jgi:cell division protein FtsW (lipid II flippase)
VTAHGGALEHGPRRYTRAALHEQARPLHQPRIALLNAGWVCVFAALCLSLLGIAAIGTTEPRLALRHAAHLIAALAAAGLVVVPHPRVARQLAYPLLGFSLLLLIFVLIPWVPQEIVRPRNGARRWIDVGIDFQPSELAKVTYVLALASYLRGRSSQRRFLGLAGPIVITLVPMGLILVEPDLGTALLFPPALLAILIGAGSRLRHLALLAALALAAAPLAYPMLQPHQKDRIKAMLAQIRGDDTYQRDIGFQGAAAMNLVGAGRMAGVGAAEAEDLIEYNALPEEHNDMIFAVIACRWGAVGALSVWALFALFTLGGLALAGQCKDAFGRVVVIGLVALIFVQMTINTGMTIGVLPITGMTLPFVSAGGSSLLGTWIMVGLLMSVGLRRPQYMARQGMEHEEKGLRD